MGEIAVRYLAGAGGMQGARGHLIIAPDQVCFRQGKKFPLQWGWPDVQRIAFEIRGAQRRTWALVRSEL